MYGDYNYYNQQDQTSGQINLPESTGGYGGWQPPQPREKKKRKAPRIIAAALGVAVLSASAGAGGAWWVLENYDLSQPAAPQSQTQSQTPVVNTNSSAQSGQNSITSVVDAAAASVVEITTEVAQYNPFFGEAVSEGAGSGVIVTEDGYIVTNNHVVEGASSILVRDKDGNEYPAKLVGTDERTDLAVIKVEATGLKAAVFADSDNIQVGELAVAIGNPLGELGGTVTSGIISATGREMTIGGESMTLLQTSAAVNPGNSGGGLFDEAGNLVGIVNAKSAGSGIEGLAFAIPSNTVRQVMDSIIENGYVAGRPKLGITVQEVSDMNSMLYYQVREPGVYIVSPGENEGLQTGDRIVRIGETEVTGSGDVSKSLEQYQVGDVVTIVVSRSGAEVETQVTLTEYVPEGFVVNKL